MLKHLSKTLEKGNSSKDYKSQHREKKGIYQRDAFDFIHVVKNWEKIVGPKLAKNTAPVKIFNGQLIILTSHSLYSNELSFLNNIIIKKISENFPSLKGKIKKLSFQTANNYFKQKNNTIEEQIKQDLSSNNKNKLHPYSPEYQRLQSEAEEKFGHIEDNELKEIIKNLYIQSDQK